MWRDRSFGAADEWRTTQVEPVETHISTGMIRPLLKKEKKMKICTYNTWAMRDIIVGTPDYFYKFLEFLNKHHRTVHMRFRSPLHWNAVNVAGFNPDRPALLRPDISLSTHRVLGAHKRNIIIWIQSVRIVAFSFEADSMRIAIYFKYSWHYVERQNTQFQYHVFF